ncbi:MAG: DALR anticodon-binding domain-containing protein, partial [Hyphomonadaceae bacterium]
AAYKRAANILRAEEKKNAGLSTLLQSGEYPQERLFSEKEERALFAALTEASARAKSCVEKEDFTGAMAALAKLRAPVDVFFEAVLVNAEENETRLNRLALLTRFRAALHEVADFSKIEG